MRGIIVLFLIFASFDSPAIAEDGSGANSIFVQALRQYRAIPRDAPVSEQFSVLDNLVRTLDTIVDKHPNSPLAVPLVTGQQIGDVDHRALRRKHEDLFVRVCLHILKRIVGAHRRNFNVHFQRAKAAVDEELAKEQSISAAAQQLLNAQLAALRRQLARLEIAREASEAKSEDKGARIVNLGRRLNQALASKVEELARYRKAENLARYRSEFIGRLRKVRGNRQGIRIVSDRLEIQSEVLFSSGKAELQVEGRQQLAQLAATLNIISKKIPTKLDWIIQIDGHTDKIPIKTQRFPSNWELSSARAMAVVRQLVTSGFPTARLAAAGFGQFQPLDPRDDEISYRRNRRIEIKLINR